MSQHIAPVTFRTATRMPVGRDQLLDAPRHTTAPIYFVPDVFVTGLIQGHVDSVSGSPVVAVCESPFTGFGGLIKRASDIVLSFERPS